VIKLNLIRYRRLFIKVQLVLTRKFFVVDLDTRESHFVILILLVVRFEIIILILFLNHNKKIKDKNNKKLTRKKTNNYSFLR
jgi:hypothetical protein